MFQLCIYCYYGFKESYFLIKPFGTETEIGMTKLSQYHGYGYLGYLNRRPISSHYVYSGLIFYVVHQEGIQPPVPYQCRGMIKKLIYIYISLNDFGTVNGPVSKLVLGILTFPIILG